MKPRIVVVLEATAFAHSSSSQDSRVGDTEGKEHEQYYGTSIKQINHSVL